MGIIGLLTTIAIPSFLHWLPGIRLKSAARDMYSNMQLARIQALKDNTSVPVRFDVTNDSYYFDTDGDNNWTAGEFRIFLNTYKSGVTYGTGTAALQWDGATAVPAMVTKEISFSNSGTANSDTVYIENEDADICYALTVLTSGAIKLRKFNGVGWN